MALYITETDADGNPVRTDPYTPAQPPPVYANRGAPYVTAQQTGSNPLYFLLGVALLATAVALATIALYSQGKLDGAIAWLEARGIDVAPIVEVLESDPVGDPAVEGVEIPEGVAQPLPEIVAPTPAAPPAAPNPPDTAALVPQPHTPFYTWEASVPAYDPSNPATTPAFESEEQRLAFEAWIAQQPPPAPAAPTPAPEQVPAPEPEPAPADVPQEAPSVSIVTYPTPVPQAQRGPIAGGQAWGSGPHPGSTQPATQQPAPSGPDSPVNPSYSAPQAIQPAQPFYEYTVLPSVVQAVPEPPSAPVVANPSYTVPKSIQPAPAPGCLLEPACAAGLGQ